MKPSHAFFGLALIVLGVLFLLDRLTVIRFANWWPLLLIVFGLWLVITKGRMGYSDQGGTEQASGQAPPSPVVGTPPGMLSGESGPAQSPSGAQAASGAEAPPGVQPAYASRVLDFERSVAFSEMHERYASTLRRGKATAVFGSGVVDLSQAVIPPEGASVEAVAVFGSIRVYAPAGCRVSLKGTPVLGSYELKLGAVNAMGAGPELRMEGVAVLGSVEVFQ